MERLGDLVVLLAELGTTKLERTSMLLECRVGIATRERDGAEVVVQLGLEQWLGPGSKQGMTGVLGQWRRFVVA